MDRRRRWLPPCSARCCCFTPFDPWRFPNDDNGAWFSAVARSHIHAGLAGDPRAGFLHVAQDGRTRPYLHHPPMPGLILAAAFGLVGRDSPGIASMTFALLHLLTFALVAGLAARLWDPGESARSSPTRWRWRLPCR